MIDTKIKEQIIAKCLATEVGREKLASSMFQPLRVRLREKSSLGTFSDELVTIWDRLMSHCSNQELDKPVFQELNQLMDSVADLESECQRARAVRLLVYREKLHRAQQIKR